MANTIFYMREGLYLKNVAGKGRGVFCTSDIKAGEVLEIAPLMALGKEDTECIKLTKLNEYVFSLHDVAPELLPGGTAEGGSGVGMGLMSYCNHLHTPNAVENTLNDGFAPCLELRALKDIPKDTEICVDYGIDWFVKQKLWKQSLKRKKDE